MDIAAYTVEADVEERHWWFVGRRWLFSREIAALGLPVDVPILEVGTGTGTNLRMLGDLGFQRVVGLDLSDEAIRFCAEKRLGDVRRGDVCALPFEDASFELVLATDILEHVADDALALCEIARVLKPGGRMLMTVPAFDSLWGLQDEVAHHHRRYRLPPIKRAVEAAGLRLVRCFYFNYLLFVPIWLVRQVLRMLDVKLASENQLNFPLLNSFLKLLFEFDVRTAPWLKPPFGVSICVGGEKPVTASSKRGHHRSTSNAVGQSATTLRAMAQGWGPGPESWPAQSQPDRCIGRSLSGLITNIHALTPATEAGSRDPGRTGNWPVTVLAGKASDSDWWRQRIEALAPHRNIGAAETVLPPGALPCVRPYRAVLQKDRTPPADRQAP